MNRGFVFVRYLHPFFKRNRARAGGAIPTSSQLVRGIVKRLSAGSTAEIGSFCISAYRMSASLNIEKLVLGILFNMARAVSSISSMAPIVRSSVKSGSSASNCAWVMGSILCLLKNFSWHNFVPVAGVLNAVPGASVLAGADEVGVRFDPPVRVSVRWCKYGDREPIPQADGGSLPPAFRT
jgi:hypothetical protein